MTRASANITTELIAHADGRAVAYIDATSVVIFVYQEDDGSYVISVYTRDDSVDGRLCLRLDGQPIRVVASCSHDRAGRCRQRPRRRRAGVTPAGGR